MLSIVIIALNEAGVLPATLRAALAQAGDFEVIVVDGGSTDATVETASQFPGVEVLHTAPGRAVQMNAGAAHARGDKLLFLHADTILGPDAVLEVERSIAGFGGFRQRFSSPRRDLAFVSWLHNWRCRLTGVFYGDQAMFVTRRLFASVGGFPAVDELEDIMLSERLLEQGRPDFLSSYVHTDSRKFEQLGVARSLWYCIVILVCYQLRVPLRGRAFFAPIR